MVFLSVWCTYVQQPLLVNKGSMLTVKQYSTIIENDGVACSTSWQHSITMCVCVCVSYAIMIPLYAPLQSCLVWWWWSQLLILNYFCNHVHASFQNALPDSTVARVNLALKKAVADGRLIRIKDSFKLGKERTIKRLKKGNKMIQLKEMAILANELYVLLSRL